MTKFLLDSPTNIYLDRIEYFNIHVAQEINQDLFPVEYNASYYLDLVTHETSEGFFFKYYSDTLGLCTFRMEEKECYVMTFGILPIYRDVGVGSICINMIEEYVLNNYNAEYIKLHVHVNNIKGIEFYKKNKYKVYDIEEEYYRTLEEKSAYVLIKYIK